MFLKQYLAWGNSFPFLYPGFIIYKRKSSNLVKLEQVVFVCVWGGGERGRGREEHSNIYSYKKWKK